MKTILFALGVIVAVSGLFIFVSRRDPNPAETRESFSILRENSLDVPVDPAAVGFLNLTSRVSAKPMEYEDVERVYSVEAAVQRLQAADFQNSADVIEGTIRRQQYRLTQFEYKLAQLQRLGGDISEVELEKRRMAYADATKAFQKFWDAKRSLN